MLRYPASVVSQTSGRWASGLSGQEGCTQVPVVDEGNMRAMNTRTRHIATCTHQHTHVPAAALLAHRHSGDPEIGSASGSHHADTPCPLSTRRASRDSSGLIAGKAHLQTLPRMPMRLQPNPSRPSAASARTACQPGAALRVGMGSAGTPRAYLPSWTWY